MAELRRRAIDQFVATGVPVKSEAWKYTNIARILKEDLPDVEIEQEGNVAEHIPDCTGWTAVCVNGRFRSDLSNLPDEPGVVVSGLADALSKDPTLASSHLGAYADIEDEALVALNTAFATDGVFIQIADGISVAEPIHLINLVKSPNAVIAQVRHLVIVGANAKVSVIEHDIAIVGRGTFTNSVFEATIGENGLLKHYRLQEKQNADHVDSTYVRQAAHSAYRSCTVATGIGIVRNNVSVRLAGESCETTLLGLCLGGLESHIDTYTLIDHAEPNCLSNELYKSILCDSATSTFRGKLLVRKDAQQTRAFQSNRNLLLSEDAVANSLPQLEIFADDVKCSHGATTGVLDQEALFYLRTRGIPRPQARRMLIEAFVDEVVNEITDDSVRTRIDEILHSFLKRAAL